jgi:hypothetical protein
LLETTTQLVEQIVGRQLGRRGHGKPREKGWGRADETRTDQRPQATLSPPERFATPFG